MWDIQTSMILLLCLLRVFLVLFIVKKLLKNNIQRSTLRQDYCGWQSVKEDMGRYSSLLSSLMGLKFTLKQAWNPKKLTECFRKVCPDPCNAKEL